MPDTKHVVNIAILNMARFGTEMACFRFMLNSDISLIALFISITMQLKSIVRKEAGMMPE